MGDAHLVVHVRAVVLGAPHPKSVLKAVDEHAKGEGLEQVILHVEDDNDAAIAFYEAQNFARVKVDRELRQFGTALGLNPDIHYLFSRDVKVN